MTLWSCPLCCTRKSSLCLSDLVASCFRSRWSHRFQTSDSVTQPSRRATARESTFVLNHFVRKQIGQGRQSVVMFSPNTTEMMHLQPRPECSSKNKAFIFLTFLGGLQDTYENDSWHFQESEPTEHLLREAGLKPDHDFSLATEPVSRTHHLASSTDNIPLTNPFIIWTLISTFENTSIKFGSPISVWLNMWTGFHLTLPWAY